jgi:hypothetical protein
MWKCPKCGESLHDYEESCWNCKVKTGPAGVPPGGATPAVAREPMKKCPFCAEEIRLEAIKCRFCGSAMPEAQKPPVASSRDNITMLKNVMIAVLILATAAAAVWGAILLYGPVFNMISSKTGASNGSDKDISVKGVAYEEILEYDGKGNVKKTLKTYPQEKGKGK